MQPVGKIRTAGISILYNQTAPYKKKTPRLAHMKDRESQTVKTGFAELSFVFCRSQQVYPSIGDKHESGGQDPLRECLNINSSQLTPVRMNLALSLLKKTLGGICSNLFVFSIK